MFELAMVGIGVHGGRAVAAIDLPGAITDKGTWYFQVAATGPGAYPSMALASGRPEEFFPDFQGDASGYSGPVPHWIEGTRTVSLILLGESGVRNISTEGGGAIGLSMEPLHWYEFWVHVDMPMQQSGIYVRSETTGIPEPVLLASAAPFRRPDLEDELVSVLLMTWIGALRRPLIGHPFYINGMALDFEGHRLDRPAELQPPPPLPGSVAIYGMELIEPFADGTVYFHRYICDGGRMLGHVDLDPRLLPWVRSLNLETYLYLPTLEAHPPVGRTPDLDLMAQPGLWGYVVNAAPGADPPTASPGPVAHLPGFLGYVHTGHEPWLYSYNLGTWLYVPALENESVDTLREKPATWVFLVNADRIAP